MLPVARARAARALEGHFEGRARAQALPTDRYAPPALRAHAPRYVDAPPYARRAYLLRKC